MSIIVADASPLIALATIGRIGLLKNLYHEVWIPVAVSHELKLDSDMQGSMHLKQAMEQGWLQCKTYDYPQDSYQRLCQIIDIGEVEAILLAESQAHCQDYRFLLMDERKGRKIAQNRGVDVAGSGVVLLTAKKKGYIESVKTELNAMYSNGYRMSKALQKRLLEMAEEV